MTLYAISGMEIYDLTLIIKDLVIKIDLLAQILAFLIYTLSPNLAQFHLY